MNKRLEKIIQAVEGLSTETAVFQLTQAIDVVVSLHADNHAEVKEVRPMNPLFLDRKAGRLSKIDSDPEVRDFIDELGRASDVLTLQEIAEACFERFGPERAPSKSGVHRHLIKMKAAKRAMEQAGEHKSERN